MFYVVHVDLPVCGYDTYIMFEADEGDVDQIAQEIAMDHAESYFNLDYYGEYSYIENDEDYEWGYDYIFASEVGWSYEEYDAEKHDELL